MNQKEGIASGSITVNVSDVPGATISGGASICEGEETLLTVDLTGTAPWTFIYEFNNINKTVTTEENTHSIPVSEAGIYTLRSVESGNCFVQLDSNTEIEVKETPTVLLSGGGGYFEGGSTTLNFDMTGDGPWTVIYSNGSQEMSFTTDDEHHEVQVDQEGIYSLVSVEANGCITESDNSIEVYLLSTASLVSDNQSI